MSSKTNKDLYKVIQEQQTNLEYLQEFVAAELGIPRTAVSQIENGDRGVLSSETVRLAEILGTSTQTTNISSERKSYGELEEMYAPIKSDKTARTLSVDGVIINKIAYEKFIQEVGEQRFFWISATPINTKEINIDPTSENVKQLMKSPPGTTGQRIHGWGMQFEHFQPISIKEGEARGRKDYRYYEILPNGHLELWVPLKSFSRGQNPHEFERQPRLRPLIYTEFILNFFHFYNHLMEISGAANQASVYSIAFHNLKGFSLPLSDWDSSDAPTYKHDSFELLFQKFENSYYPDLLTKYAVTELQSAFNLPTDQIPFYDKWANKFEFPLW